ncbi:hypothetical protein KY289_011667 [Solanum tuberosum]|uniref:Zinc ion binding protein n=1 Tax=Solanum tuberosum TaxID=4113 RepID=M1CX44_SOLTU|nr:hypothetical protein KY289_011667 [Solanum tuberosum]
MFTSSLQQTSIMPLESLERLIRLGQDSNLQSSGHESDELTNSSTPRLHCRFFCRERTLPFSTLWQRNGCADFVSNFGVEILDASSKGMTFEQSMPH